MAGWSQLMLALAVIACSESKETRLQRFLAQGNDMVNRNNPDQAIGYYNGALQLDSCFADAWNNLGTVYYHKRDFDKAVTHYSRALECEPGKTQARLNRANTYFEKNELYRALKDLEIIERERPDTVALYFLRGLIFSRMQRYNESLRAFRAAFARDSANAELVINMGIVYYYKKDFDSARYYLKPVTERNIREPNAYNTFALIEAESGRPDIALGWINKALKVRPSDPYYLNNRGYIYLIAEDLDKALADINESISLDPYNGWAYRNKGMYYLKKQQPADALRMFQRAYDLDKSIENINYFMGESFRLTGNVESACNSFRKSVEAKEPMHTSITLRCQAD